MGSRAVLVMADYSLDWPLWDAGTEPVDTANLPVSPPLTGELEAWCRIYRGPVWERSDPDWSEDAYHAWIAHGRRLAQRLQHELGDEYEVRYHDDATSAEERVSSN